MKVHLIRKETIQHFVSRNARSRSSFEEFLEKLKNADWERPTDMNKTFGATDLLGKSSNRAVFNYWREYICWIGTHASYDKLCEEQLQYDINDF